MILNKRLPKEQRKQLYNRFKAAQNTLPKKSVSGLFFSTYPELDCKKGRVLFLNMTYNKSHNIEITKKMEILAKHIALAKVRASDEWDFVKDIS